MHAICHSSDIYVHPCVYVQVSDPNEESNCYPCYSPGFSYELDELNSSCECEESAESTNIEEILFSPEDPSLSTWILAL